MKHIILATALCLATSSPAFAQFNNITEGWSGDASLTGSRTTGNTDTLDFGAGLKLQKEDGPWTHKFKANADFGEVDDQSTRERYDLGYQIERDFNDRLYGFANGDYYKDEFGAFQDGWFLGGGLGYKVILPDPVGWNLEGGAGFRSQQAQDFQGFDADGVTLSVDADGNPILTEGLTENEFALRGFSDFDYAFNDNVSLYNDTEILWASSDTYIWNEIGLTAKLAGNLSARASFRVDHHTDAPVGTESTDTTTRFGIVYSIK